MTLFPAEGDLESDYSTIRLERAGPVARLTLDRPAVLNALDETMLAELLHALDRVHRDRALSLLVVRSDAKAFCAGVDIDSPYFFTDVGDDSVYAGTRLLDEQHRLIAAVDALPQVTVAAVNGDAVGGSGFGLAMACDLRYAVASARFWMIPTRLDVIQDFGLTWLLQRQIGTSRTLEMAITGRPVTGEEGVALGFVNGVVDTRAALDARVDAFAQQVSESGADSVRALKLMVRAGRHSSLGDQLGLEAVANGLTFQSAEFRAKHGDYLARLGRS